MKNTIKYGIVIGRFNPPHIGHLRLIEAAIENNDYVIVVLGSYKTAYSPKRLFNEESVSFMLKCGVSNPEKLIFLNVRDSLYDDNAWLMDVRKGISNIVRQSTIDADSSFTVYGFTKDQSSQYLKWFPFYNNVEVDSLTVDGNIIHATDIRNTIFETWNKHCSNNVNNITINDFVHDLHSQIGPLVGNMWDALVTEMVSVGWQHIANITDEYNHYKGYKKAWEKAPYAPTFVTGDAVVFCNGCVLLIKRKNNPGRGCYAVPGGFINQDETVKECILRELKEETKIDVPPGKLANSLREIVLFDAPGRSLRGRTITHAGLIVLDEVRLPKVKGSDDALSAEWFPLEKIGALEDKFFEDHAHVVKHLMSKI